MPEIIRNDFSNGLVTARDRADLGPGELQNATGITYRRNDRRAWQVPGRTAFGTALADNAVNGLQLLQFDDGGTDLLVALAATGLYSAENPEKVASSFSLDVGGKDVLTDRLHSVHMDNKWFLTTGKDANSVFEAGGTNRNMGMVSPQEAPSVTPKDLSATANTSRAGVVSSTGWDNEDNAKDADTDSFASAFLKTAGSAELTLSGWGSSTTAARRLEVFFFLAGAQFEFGEGFEQIEEYDTGYNVSVKLEISEDDGVTYTSFSNESYSRTTPQPIKVVHSIDQGGITVNSNKVRLRVTLTYNSGTSPCTLRLLDAPIVIGSDAAAFDTSTGLIYSIAEYSETYGIYSAPGAPSAVNSFVLASGHNAAEVTLPSAARNSITSHYIIYRNSDGGAIPKQLGVVARVPISEASGLGHWVDDFATPATEQPLPIVPLKIIRRGTTELAVPRDSSPPVFDFITKFRGQLIGLLGRKMWWAEAGFPESVPEINVITDFELKERDELVAAAQIGDTLWIGFTNAIVFLDGLPTVSDGNLIQPPKRQLSGYPGVTSSYGFAVYEEGGTPRLAWVSRHGIYATDGFRGMLLTQEIDWPALVSEENLSSAVLHWNQRQSILTFAYASGSSGNDRYLRLHMDQSHRKQGGVPKITGPHYGKISSMTSGEVGGKYKVFSGHASNGVVYNEETGNLDKSLAYDGSSDTIRLDVTQGRAYSRDRRMYAATVGSLRHSDATGETVAVTVSTGRDDGDSQQTVEKTVKLDGNRGTEFFLGRAGEWTEFRVVGAVKADWALQEMVTKARIMSQAGTVKT